MTSTTALTLSPSCQPSSPVPVPVDADRLPTLPKLEPAIDAEEHPHIVTHTEDHGARMSDVGVINVAEAPVSTPKRKLQVGFAADAMLGHLSPLLPYAEELLKRGHAVTFFHHSEAKYRNKLVASGLEHVTSVTCDLERSSKKGTKFNHLTGAGALFDTMVEHYGVKAYRPPDLVVYDFFAVGAADAADHFGCPAICVFPNAAVTINPSLRQAGILKKLVGCFMDVAEAVGARLVLRWRNKTRTGRSLPPMVEQDIWPCKTMKRLTIGCTGLGLEFASKAMSPLFVMVGPSLPTNDTLLSQVSPELDAWMNAQTLPVVYVAFGTMFRHTSKSVQALQAQLAQANVAVLWALPENQQAWLMHTSSAESSLDRWKIVGFVPQVEVLASGKLAAFVSHCGSNSLYEALLSRVPIVAVPGHADQPGNALRVQAAGVGVISRGGIKGVAAALEEVILSKEALIERADQLCKVLATFGGSKRAATVMEDAAKFGYAHMVPPATRSSCLLRLVCVLLCAVVAATFAALALRS